MRLFLLFVLCATVALPSEQDSPLTTAQKLFDAMQSHDSVLASSLFLPGATLSSLNAEGKASIIPFEQFVERIGGSKDQWVERIWNPQVLEEGHIAVVWAKYDFHLNGKFHHCGVDSFQMLKTDEGWKISAISDTRSTASCEPNPAGAPKSK